MAEALEVVSGTVKWFNAEKGFGFVRVDGREADAFIHVTVVRDSGCDGVFEADRVECEVAASDKGLQVRRVLAVRHSDAASPGAREISGRVKFYNSREGYGFVVHEGEGDVFIGGRVLSRCGIGELHENQPVKVLARPGNRGLMAERIELVA